MSPDELRALGEDIRANGLRLPIAITSDRKLLDGRNRLDAMEAAGVKFEIKYCSHNKSIYIDAHGGDLSFPEIVKGDPVAFVISANIHRRHLTGEQKRNLIAKLIKAIPEKSDRQIAETVKASPTTVGTVRAEMEVAGDVSKLDTRRDRRGRQQPARKRSPRNMVRNGLIRATKLGPDVMAKIEGTSLDSAAEQNALIDLDRGVPEGEHTDIVKKFAAAAAAGKQLSAVKYIETGAALRREDIGADSMSEADRLRAHNEQLEAENARLQAKIAGLESEIVDLKAAAKSAPASKSGSRCSICHKNKPTTLRPVFICDECVHVFDVREVMPVPDDGLDPPKILLRQPKEMVS
jgi:hypothetical protein